MDGCGGAAIDDESRTDRKTRLVGGYRIGDGTATIIGEGMATRWQHFGR